MLSYLLLAMRAFHDWDWGAGGWLWMLFMMIFGVAVLAILIWAGFKLMAGNSGAGPGMRYPNIPEQPLEIARKRYAAGDITKEQLEEIERTLRGG